MRAKAEIEEMEGGLRERIVIREIPFMVNKTRLIEQIAGLVRDKKVTEISVLRDESDREGMRIVVELKRDAVSHIVLNKLYKHTQMQATFGTILLALVNGEPKVMTLREMLNHFIDHRHVVVVKRSEFDLRKAQAREHILEGLKIAVDNIDRVIKIIRGSADAPTASAELQSTFELSDKQAEAILNMRLARLTGLEMEKLEAELAEVQARIAELEELLGSREMRMEVIREELEGLAEKYGDDRRTSIIGEHSDLDMEDLIADEEMVITLSHQGYVKRIPVGTYRAQRRGGRGLQGMNTKDEDWVEHLFVASTHDYLMIFTRDGQCYWLKVWQIPQGSRISRGKPIVNLLEVGKDARIASVVPVREFTDDRFLLFATRQGTVKKTALSAYGNVRNVGLNAINIREDDELIDVRITGGDNEVILATHHGMAIRFHESDARTIGRATEGVRGIALQEDDWVVGMVVVRDDSTLLVVTEGGMGKRSEIDTYRLQKRGGKGVINMRISERTGNVVAIRSVLEEDEVMLITRNGVVNRQPIGHVRVIGRATQGVRLVNLDKGDLIMDVARIIPEDADDEDEDALSGVETAVEGDDPVDETGEQPATTGETAEGE
jgi:DNA gyrase subunit A